MNPCNWYHFRNQASDPTVAEILIVDIIGDWIDELVNEFVGMKATLTAKAFIDQLSKLDAKVKTIRVRINSPGGDVFAAINIANALRDQQLSKGRTVETIVDGLAASSASLIAMAGRTVTMADNALMMVHLPWTWLSGNAKAHQAAADELATITRNALIPTYQWHSPLSETAILALLEGEEGQDGSWFGADEAIARGFATHKRAGLQAAASLSPRVAALKVPDRFRTRVAAMQQPAPGVQPRPPLSVIDGYARNNQPGRGLNASEIYAARNRGGNVDRDRDPYGVLGK